MPPAYDRTPHKRPVKRKSRPKRSGDPMRGSRVTVAPRPKLGPPTPKPVVRGTKGPKRAASFRKGDTYKTVRKRAVHKKKQVERAPHIKGPIGGGNIGKKRSGGAKLLNFAASTAAPYTPGPAGAILRTLGPKAGKAAENATHEAIDLPANVVPSVVHIAKPAYKHPGSPKAYLESGKRAGEAAIDLPKKYVKAAEKHGAKGVVDTFVEHPLTTALTVAPLPRGPGLVAGGVARRAGKMPKIAAKELPETAMKEAVPRSKSYFKAKRQAKKGTGKVEDKHIERRVDEQVALMEDLTRRTQASTYRKAYRVQKKKPGVSKKKARDDAALLAKEAEKKVRTEQKHNIVEGMAIVQKPKYSHGHLIEPAKPKAQTWEDFSAAKGVADRYSKQHGVDMVPVPHPGGYAVMPKSGVERLVDHAANTRVGPVGAAAKAYNTVWRKNVLATHPTWYAGNTIEAAIRSVASGVGPTAYVRGYKGLGELKRTDPKAYAEMTGHATKGGHLAMQAHLPEETKIDITGANNLAKTARAVQGLRGKPGIRQVADGWNNVTDFAMGTLSGKIESAFQTGMLGKELARSPLMDGHVLKTSKAAIADAAKGMKETHNQVALGQAVDRMYGQYGKFSPGMRKAIANYTPFIAWTMNSLKWLYHYLPADHPVLVAAAASSQPYVDEWLKDQGLSAFVKGALPSFLRGSIPTKGGYARFPTRYSPFAIAAGAPEDLAGTVLPQFKSSIDVLQHQINWKGQKLKNPDGTPLDPNQLMVMAGLNLLEGMVPASQQFLGVSDRYEHGARTPKKLVKPKSGEEILGAFNPLKQVKTPKDSKDSKGSKKSSNPFDTGTTKRVTKKKKSTNPFDSP